MSNVSVGNVQGTMTLNANQFVGGANQAVGALKQLELATAANWWGLRNLGVALGAIPAAVATGVGASISAYMEWEDAIAGVERTTYRAQTATETAAEANERNAQTLQGIVDGLKEIASSTPVAASTLAGIAEAAGALGVAETDIISFTKVVADLDATTDLTANSAAVNLARIAGLTGVAGQGYDNLASSILEVGRSTAATEQEIVDIANRIAGIASVANLSAAEVIGFAGALRSAGVRSEQGGTAFQKTFSDIIQAVANGGDNLELFARISGKTSEQLQQDFSANAADAFTDFIAGLGQLNDQGENVIGVLGQLGITEARQTQTLLLLAQAESQVVNENLRLSNSLDTSRDAFAEGNAISDIAAKRYRTLSSQIQLLRNEIFLAAQGFGATFAPIISFVVARLRDFVAGMSALPAPIKIAVGIVVGLTVALLGLASAAILLGPRLVLAVTALRQLGSTSGTTVGGLSATSVAMGGVSRQARAMAASTTAAAVSMTTLNGATAAAATSMLGGGAANSAKNAQQLGQAAQGATVGLSGMTLWASRLGKGLGILGAVLTVGSVLLTVFGNGLRNQSAALTDVVSSNVDLYNILAQNNNQVDANTAAWIKQSDMWPRIQAGLDRYGSSLAEVEALVQGTASADQYRQFLAETSAAYDAGDKGAKDYADSVILLSRTFAESRKEVASILGPIQDVTNANKDFEDSFNTEEEIRELEKLRKTLDDQARSHSDYVSALQGQQRAQFDLIDAQRAYSEALANAQDPTRVLADLERRLAQARRSSEKAQESLADAERNLATARQRQQESLSDAMEDVTDAQDNYTDAQQKLRDAEAELAKLRQGPELKNIVKATNDLRNAQLRLLRASQDVEDAEWQLQYLREEGASKRDIEDAELALAEARQEVANANEDITESEDELAAARQGASARELADAEEAVADALRDTQRAYDDLLEKEEEVRRIREDIANDTAYLDAERDLADARDNAAEAIEAIADAERALREARDFGIMRDLRQAELDLTDAIYNTAKANAEARIAQLRMNGVYVDAGTEAAILAEELGKLGRLAPTAAQQKRLQNYIDILRSAPESGPPVEAELPEFDMDSFDPGQVPIPLMPDLDEFSSAFEDYADEIPGATESIWRQLWDEYGVELAKMAGLAIAGAIVAAVLGVPALVGAAIVGLAYFIATTFGEDFVAFCREIVGPAIANFFTKTLPRFFMETVPSAFGKAFFAVTNTLRTFFTRTIPDLLINLIPQSFVSAIDLFSDVGWDLITGFWNGMKLVWTNVSGWFAQLPFAATRALGSLVNTLFFQGKELIVGIGRGATQELATLALWIFSLPGRLVRALGDMAGQFVGKGRDVINGIARGINEVVGTLGNYMIELPWKLVRLVGDIFSWFIPIGKDIIYGIKEGIWRVGGQIVDLILDFCRDAWNAVKGFFGIRSPSTEMAWIGQMMMYGLRDGLQDYARVAENAATDAAQGALDAFNSAGLDTALNDLLATEAARMSLAVGGGGFGPSGVTATPTTVINEGDTFNLEAITTADPAAIVDEFMWANLVRT